MKDSLLTLTQTRSSVRQRLGTHVTQKGSLNAPDRLRFDISQPRPLTPEELTDVVNLAGDALRARWAE